MLCKGRVAQFDLCLTNAHRHHMAKLRLNALMGCISLSYTKLRSIGCMGRVCPPMMMETAFSRAEKGLDFAMSEDAASGGFEAAADSASASASFVREL